MNINLNNSSQSAWLVNTNKPVYKGVGMPCQKGGKQGKLWCGTKDQHVQIIFTLQSFVNNHHMIVRVTQWSGVFLQNWQMFFKVVV